MALEITFTLPYTNLKRRYEPRAHIYTFGKVTKITYFPTDDDDQTIYSFFFELQRTVTESFYFYISSQRTKKKLFPLVYHKIPPIREMAHFNMTAFFVSKFFYPVSLTV